MVTNTDDFSKQVLVVTPRSPEREELTAVHERVTCRSHAGAAAGVSFRASGDLVVTRLEFTVGHTMSGSRGCCVW